MNNKGIINDINEKTKIPKLKKEITSQSLFLNQLDFHLRQKIFKKLLNHNMIIEEQQGLTQTKILEHYKTFFENYLSFSLVCKQFNLISKNTLFKLKNFKKELIIENTTYLIYLKLTFIQQYIFLKLKKLFTLEKKKEDISELLIYSSLHGFYDLIELLINNGADVNYKTVEGWNISFTSLSQSCAAGYLKTTKTLVKHGGDIHFQDPQHLGSLLINACMRDNLKLVKYLVEFHGLNINTETEFRQTPLGVTCLNGSLHTAKYLISLGADVNHIDTYNETLLFGACESGNLELLQCLLDLGLKVNHKSEDGRTCIFDACSFQHLEAVKLLISRGADLSIKHKGKTLLQIVKSDHERSPELIKELEKYF